MNNIFEMLSFDFLEFATSTAGILIIVGIVCLIVGICIFLKEGKKAAKPTEVKEEAKTEEAQVSATPETPAQPEVAPVEAAPAVETPAVEAAVEATPIVVNATEDGVNEVPVPTVNDTLNISEPAVETPVVEAPAVEAPVVEAPVVESLEEAQPTVYGGESPAVVPTVAEETQPREIYGGANPLENTAPIPTNVVEEANAAVAPVVEAPVVEAPVVEAPAVETPVAEAPVVETPVAPAPADVAPAPEAPKEEIEKLEF